MVRIYGIKPQTIHVHNNIKHLESLLIARALSFHLHINNKWKSKLLFLSVDRFLHTRRQQEHNTRSYIGAWKGQGEVPHFRHRRRRDQASTKVIHYLSILCVFITVIKCDYCAQVPGGVVTVTLYDYHTSKIFLSTTPHLRSLLASKMPRPSMCGLKLS